MGNCNCVGTMGAALGGGFGFFQGLYGLSVDNIVGMNVVTGDGQLRQIDSSSGDLWWAMRGSAPNFGVVTQVTIKTYQVADCSMWTGPVIFSPDKIESLITTIDALYVDKPMNIFLFYATSGPPSFVPTVLLTPFRVGSEVAGRAAFKPIFNLGPLQDNTSSVHYTRANDANNSFCE